MWLDIFIQVLVVVMMMMWMRMMMMMIKWIFKLETWFFIDIRVWSLWSLYWGVSCSSSWYPIAVQMWRHMRSLSMTSHCPVWEIYNCSCVGGWLWNCWRKRATDWIGASIWPCGCNIVVEASRNQYIIFCFRNELISWSVHSILLIIVWWQIL